MKAYYCVGTHWDREWYEPFQEFRMWLVELIDELLDLMDDDPGYKSFHLDGQAVVVQDYLEIRPERRERLVKAIKDGRLFVGPWYDLPDEWLISGESYVRNVMMGMQACKEMGVKHLDFAYTPDQFGHIAALPMIMNGFGLKAGICWRGTQDENYPAHFVWVGPDGSKMVYHKLMDMGSYSPFGMYVRDPMNREGHTDESYEKYFEKFIKDETARTKAPLILMLDAIDHQGPDHGMPKFFEEIQKRYPKIEFKWTSLAEYAEEMLKHRAKMPERKGELREPCRAHDRSAQYLIVHTISSRYPIKRRNDQCQAALEKGAEPFALFQMMAGGQPVLSYLRKAWEYLLRNHPHDSICGCSIDQVHRDMMYRFDQSDLISDGLVRRSIAAIARASDAKDAQINMVVHNALPWARRGAFDIPLVFQGDWPKAFVDGLTSAERVNKFVLVSNSGKRVPFQLKAIERGQEVKTLRTNGRKATVWGETYHVAVDMELPPCGYTAFRVEPTDEAVRNFGTLMTGPLSASNGVVAFSLNPDGTASLKSATSGKAFDNLFLYEDCGDSGDGWTRGQLINDIVFRGPGTRVTTAVDEDGALRTVFRVEREFDLPRMMDRKTSWRSDDRVPLKVTDRIYVEKGAPFVRVRTRIENTCMDHRFRVLFPTHLKSKKSFAETPFAVVERDIDSPKESATWQERVNPEKAFTTFFGIADNAGGLAVLSPFGLHEYEVLQTPDHSLALTLFRSTWKTVGMPGEPDGELLGTMEFEYLLYPFKGNFDAVDALRWVAEAQSPVRFHGTDRLPKDFSFLKMEKNAAVVTAIKPANDGNGGIVRLWNPGNKPVKDVLVLNCRVASATACNLNEEPEKKLTVEKGNRIPVSVPAGGLATVRFTWKTK